MGAVPTAHRAARLSDGEGRAAGRSRDSCRRRRGPRLSRSGVRSARNRRSAGAGRSAAISWRQAGRDDLCRDNAQHLRLAGGSRRYRGELFVCISGQSARPIERRARPSDAIAISEDELSCNCNALRSSLPQRSRPRGIPASLGLVRREELFQPVDVVVAGDDVRLLDQALEEGERGLDAVDDELVDRAAQALQALVAGAAVDDELADQGVVVGRDRVALVDRAIDADADAAGRVVEGDLAGRGGKGLRVLGVDADLDGVAVERDLVLRSATAFRPRRRVICS